MHKEVNADSETVQDSKPASDGKPPAPGSARERFPRRPVSSGADRPRTLTLQINPETGRPAWDKLSERTVGIWRDVLSHEETAKRFGLKVGEVEPPAEIISPEAVGGMFDFFGAMQAKFFAWRYKIPAEVAAQIFTYNTVEKGLLVPPAQKVLSKYAPDILAKYADELTLGFLFVSVTQAKIGHAMKLAREIQAGKSEKQPEESHTAESGPVAEVTAPRLEYAQ